MTSTAGAHAADGLDRTAPDDGIERGRRWWPSPLGIGARIVVLALILTTLGALPFGIPPVYEPVIARAIVFALVGLSMNVLAGYVGQISLGHAAFVGIGAFGAGISMTNFGLPYLPALAVAALTGAIAALILGGVALRVAGMYLALVTIAYHLFVSETLLNIRTITGGGAGMPTPRPSFALGNVPFIFVCLGVLALIWALDWRLTSTKMGRAIQALRDDERVAASWGINVTAFKLMAFVISGIIAGLAGALFASIDEIASPITFQGLTLSLVFALMVFIGGIGSRPGVIIGSALVGALATILDVTNEVWAGCTTAWAGGWIQQVGFLPVPGPRTLLLLLGAGLIAGGLTTLRGIRGAGGRGVAAKLAGAGVLLAMGGPLVVGQFVGSACLWDVFDGSAYTLLVGLGAIIVLIFYPGGLAQLLRGPIRWLSFRSWRAPEQVAGPGGPAGDAGQRP